MGGYSRRLFLVLGGAAAATALMPARTAHTPDTSLVHLRRRWRDVTAGPGHRPADRPYRAAAARLGAT
uniref:hypothetical protein n=1 Tax=Nonomuraea lactucae TaxID=2249762 RepID=UPI0013B44CD2